MLTKTTYALITARSRLGFDRICAELPAELRGAEQQPELAGRPDPARSREGRHLVTSSLRRRSAAASNNGERNA